MKPVVYIPGRWVWGSVKVGVWFVLLGVASAQHLGGWFFGLTVMVLGLRAWARSRPPVEPEPVQPSQDDALRMLRAYHYLRTLEAQRDEESVSEAPQHVEARREP